MKSAQPSTPELGVSISPPANEVARRQPEVLDMIQAFLDKGVTQENVAALRELAALKRDMDKDKAERDFTAAFVALQSEMPTITATTAIPKRGKYEKFEDIMDKISPILVKHGFSVSFTQELGEAKRVIVTCHLSHIGGHSRKHSFAVRSGAADTETQADCKASTTAKRNALCQALNIVIRQDVLDNEHDASIEGDPNALVTPEQAEELERRAHETNSNINAFLRLAAAASFKNILAKDYDMLDRLLREKEQRPR